MPKNEDYLTKNCQNKMLLYLFSFEARMSRDSNRVTIYGVFDENFACFWSFLEKTTQK